MENQLRTSQGSMETRERDYTFAITTRDEVLREKSGLMEKLKEVEEREKKKVGSQSKHKEILKSRINWQNENIISG